jgi:hypothetical protein
MKNTIKKGNASRRAFLQKERHVQITMHEELRSQTPFRLKASVKFYIFYPALQVHIEVMYLMFIYKVYNPTKAEEEFSLLNNSRHMC